MKIKYLLNSFLCILLVGCASEPNKIQYYELASSKSVQLGHSEGTSESTINIALKPLVILEAIKFSDFLKRQGIVIQRDKHKLQISSLHRWAENIESSTSRIISSQLENNLPDFRFENHTGRWKITPSFKIDIEFYQFQIDQKNKTVTSGYFWIFDGENNLIEKQKFLIEYPLEKNGYEHAISQLENSLIFLAEKISEVVKTRSKVN